MEEYIEEALKQSYIRQAEHRRHVSEVLQWLREYHLFLKAEKCSFHQKPIHFLG